MSSLTVTISVVGVLLMVSCLLADPRNSPSIRIYECTRIVPTCILEDVFIEHPSASEVERVKLPDHPYIHVTSGSILQFTGPVYEALPVSIETLHLYNNTKVNVFEIATSRRNLTEINLQRNGLFELMVEPIKNRVLRNLTIVHNQLSSIPQNIRFLEGLEQLHLYNNSISYVELDLFANAKSLKILSLHNNFISRIESRNNLRLPRLQVLSLAKNQLDYVPYIDYSFPALKMVTLRENPWSCLWLMYTVDYIRGFDIELGPKDNTTCRYRSSAGICCQQTILDFMHHVQTQNKHQDHSKIAQLVQNDRNMKYAMKRIGTTLNAVLTRWVANDVDVDEDMD